MSRRSHRAAKARAAKARANASFQGAPAQPLLQVRRPLTDAQKSDLIAQRDRESYIYINQIPYIPFEEYMGDDTYTQYLTSVVRESFPPIQYLRHSFLTSLPYTIRGICLQMLNDKIMWYSQRLHVLHNAVHPDYLACHAMQVEQDVAVQASQTLSGLMLSEHR